MLDKCIFIDTNVLIYAFADTEKNATKKAQVIKLLQQKPYISTQILNESSNVLRRKFNQNYQEIQGNLEFILKITRFIDVNRNTVRNA